MKNENNLSAKETSDTGVVSTRLLTRIAIDLEKEMERFDNETVKADLKMQIEGLKALKKEIDEFRNVKAILNVR